MTPAEIREAVARLVAAGEKATPGEWHETHGEIECDQCGEQAYLCDVTSHAEDDTPYLSLAMQFVGLESLARPNANFVCAAANARPALSALAGMCVLPVEVVETLTEAAMEQAIEEDRLAGLCMSMQREQHAYHDGESTKIRAALAAAEAEVRRVEVERG